MLYVLWFAVVLRLLVAEEFEVVVPPGPLGLVLGARLTYSAVGSRVFWLVDIP